MDGGTYANTNYGFELANIYYMTQAYLKIMYAKEGMKNWGRRIFIYSKMGNEQLIEQLCVQHCVKHIASIFLLLLIRQM